MVSMLPACLSLPLKSSSGSTFLSKDALNYAPTWLFARYKKGKEKKKLGLEVHPLTLALRRQRQAEFEGSLVSVVLDQPQLHCESLKRGEGTEKQITVSWSPVAMHLAHSESLKPVV